MSMQALAMLSSGLVAQAAAAGRAADNIANVNTPGFAARAGQPVSQVSGGVRDVPQAPSGPVDLATQVAGLHMAGTAYGVAAKAFAAVARMDRAAIDLIA